MKNQKVLILQVIACIFAFTACIGVAYLTDMFDTAYLDQFDFSKKGINMTVEVIFAILTGICLSEIGMRFNKKVSV